MAIAAKPTPTRLRALVAPLTELGTVAEVEHDGGCALVDNVLVLPDHPTTQAPPGHRP